MRQLKDVIIDHIVAQGPMSIETYWTLCLSHPEWGYYIKQDPLGAAGDFTTAPEISQLFGEMIGIWAAEHWTRLGSPSKIHLVECGPGRGTLMSDLLRIARLVPGFDDALHIHLVETSPALRAKQKVALDAWRVAWHDDLTSLPDDAPVLIIGNEFLDALPIRQYVRDRGGWRERVIGVSQDRTSLVFGMGGQVLGLDFPEAKEGEIFEFSPVREAVYHAVVRRMAIQGGAVLMIDYGHDSSFCGDTFQAVLKHQYVDVLQHQGNADLTSHIDFARLKSYTLNEKIKVTISTQKDFLVRHGAVERAGHLKRNATLSQVKDIDAALHRLLDGSQMGVMFKVLEAWV
ncbi:MAG: SAM-dependent methyltransferase [Pseudobdellovibrionaceae bacterium]|jgi:SAM-dependent MidA family methyltransferase|nr:SAM-dependent methyltransferase [Pseudobdellovibrionaceae bacterium]